MCGAITSRGHEAILIVADGNGDEVCDGIKIFDVGSYHTRLGRIWNAPISIFHKALTFDVDLFHLHDPELIPIGLKLKKLGRRVIFDSHEDVPQQMLSKPYLNRPLLWGISQAARIYEILACKQFDGVIGATPFLRRKFEKINPRSIDINNFPLVDEFANTVEWSQKRLVVCYVGGIDRVRGIGELVQAMGQLKSHARLGLAGAFGQLTLKDEVEEMPGWQRTDALGFLSRAGVRDLLLTSMAGLVTLHPLSNYIDAFPVKMFEYMSAGIPVIASDFPVWREIILGNDCGLLVDPLDSEQIAEAIDYVVTHPDEARRMGLNGRKAILEKYNWKTEEEKLMQFYQEILET